MSEKWSEGLASPEAMDTEGCALLVSAVVLKAVASWRLNRSLLKRRPNHPGYRARMAAVEHFLKSAWFESLSGLDGAALIERLNKEG